MKNILTTELHVRCLSVISVVKLIYNGHWPPLVFDRGSAHNED
nr:hypothetical protein [uncultured Desulfobacter sp.]